MEQTLPDPGLAKGEHRCPGETYQDVLRRDETGAPPQMMTESYEYLGDEPIGYYRYTSKEFLELEFEKVWSKVWQWACREEHIPNVGDYYVYDIGHRSIIIVRGDDGVIRAMDNFCGHRGTQLKPSWDNGNANRFTCRFHGWAWSTSGNIASVPCRWDFPGHSDDDLKLPSIQVDMWGGFVWVNFDKNAAPLREYLGVMPEHFTGNWDLSDRYLELHLRKRLPANWKASMGAFLEAYHVYKTHPEGLRATGDANAQYDVFGENVSRFMHTSGTQSPHIERKQTEQEILNFVLRRRYGNPDDVPKVPEGKTARDVYYKIVQDELKQRFNHDFSRFKVAETLDSIEYFVFPNAFFFPGAARPMVYRFLPHPTDPDECIFELLFLRFAPDGQEPPAPARPYDLDVQESYMSAPGMEKGLGFVYDQDTDNLAAQQRGFKGSLKGGEILGNYQEVRVRHVHKVIDKYLAQP
ncbi:MAG: aromatic ring-hydroxylating dioxygenase subunit alpha [Acidobacteria bacterium]|nr:aromatic ring-hydroxylating dioxygenase subunit alpha [Acidobacteriota bacterium]